MDVTREQALRFRYLQQGLSGQRSRGGSLRRSRRCQRVFDAARSLREAGLTVLDALDTVAGHMRDVVVEPTVKGEVSTALTARLPPPYLRECRSCEAVHAFEQPFRLAALRGGLELVPDTPPPVLRRIDGWEGPATSVPDHLDPIRAVVHLLGPATPGLVAEFLDAPVRTVRRHWPHDTVEVVVDGAPREVLADDLEAGDCSCTWRPGTDATCRPGWTTRPNASPTIVGSGSPGTPTADQASCRPGAPPSGRSVRRPWDQRPCRIGGWSGGWHGWVVPVLPGVDGRAHPETP